MLFRMDIREWESDIRVKFSIIADQPDASWQGLKGVVISLIRDLDFQLDGPQMAAVVEPFMKGFAPDQVYFSLERRFRWGLVNVDIVGS